MIVLAHKYSVLTVMPCAVWSSTVLELHDECCNTIQDVTEHMNDYMFHLALARTWKFIHTVNADFHGKEPWKLAQLDMAAFKEVLSATCHSLYVIALLLWPVMPNKMEELFTALGITFDIYVHTVES